ncbi:MAG TPA: acyl-CoA thioesterase [Flavobacteriales bacterium]|jgi:acyl-CoA thioester hydrolase|nr:acyl-CoA thioesterase [Flavobacteriales bacterium]
MANAQPDLIASAEAAISFGDLDPMGIVWHGNYYRLMELGREAFGRAYGLDAMELHAQGLFTPIVRSTIEHKAPLVYGDTAIVRARYVPDPAAKIILHYELLNKASGAVVATGTTVQVFLDRERKLLLTMPAVYAAWIAKHVVR